MRKENESDMVSIDLNRPMAEILKELSKYPVSTRVSLSGPLIIARDIAHMKLKERPDSGQGLPQYFKDHMVYYAGPAKNRKTGLRLSARPPVTGWIRMWTCSSRRAAVC